MDLQSVSLAAAGLLGGGVAVVHGRLTQTLLVAPAVRGLGGAPASTRQLTAVLLQFSTFNWLLGGLALILAAFAFGAEARLVTALLVGSSYLFATVGNFWATRGRHPGWMLYGVALVLIAIGLAPR